MSHLNIKHKKNTPSSVQGTGNAQTDIELPAFSEVHSLFIHIYTPTNKTIIFRVMIGHGTFTAWGDPLIWQKQKTTTTSIDRDYEALTNMKLVLPDGKLSIQLANVAGAGTAYMNIVIAYSVMPRDPYPKVGFNYPHKSPIT